MYLNPCTPLKFMYCVYITAQITRANRQRIENRKFEIDSTKCIYEIKPFDPCYDPKVSSKSSICNTNDTIKGHFLLFIIET